MKTARTLIAFGIIFCLSAQSSIGAEPSCVVASEALGSGSFGVLTDPKKAAGDVFRKILRVESPRFHVTTDGAPDSVSQFGHKGKQINTLCNSVQAYQVNEAGDRIAKVECTALLPVWDQFRDLGWVDPPGYEIVWQSALISRTINDREVPCVLTSGEYKDNIATRTKLNNNLGEELRGECGINDQVNPRVVPGITIQAGSNFIRASGVQLGDLAIVRYDRLDEKGVRKISYEPALIVDSGSVQSVMGTLKLNATLLGVPVDVKSIKDSFKLSLKHPVTALIIPGSRGYALKRPFSEENISDRWQRIITDLGFSSNEEIFNFAENCSK